MLKLTAELSYQNYVKNEHLNLKKAGLASRNIVLKYITLCQPCSSLWTSHRLFFKFG